MRYASTWIEARIRHRRDVARNVRLFAIEPEVGAAKRYRPGAHINVSVIVDGRSDLRSYSLVGLHDPACYRIAVQRAEDSRGGSAYVWSLAPGARVTITEPHTLFELDYHLHAHLLLAGGIGITPILGMAQALARRGADLRLAYCGRHRSVMPFVDDLRDALGDRLALHVSAEGGRLDIPAAIAALPEGGGLYVCGPMRLLDAARRAWAEAGRDPAKLRYETFGSSGRHAREAFWVDLPRYNMRIMVGENQTMLDALEAAGIAMIHDCRRGECGVCAVDVVTVAGAIDHRDVFFSESERVGNGRMCACVSRAVGGGVVIDTAYRPD